MYSILKNIKFLFEFLRCFPHLIIFYLHKNNSLIRADIARWQDVLNKSYSPPVGLIYMLAFHRAYRNIFYSRIGSLKYVLNIFCPGISTLLIHTEQIGEGLFIWHGFSTGIGAKSIGKNCTINQQVTIGNSNGYPTILDNVRIQAGATIVGNITIGNNVTIGANSTVLTNVPDNSTVFPAPCRIMKWNTKNIHTTDGPENESRHQPK
jgi:serine O-acetyltransferase